MPYLSSAQARAAISYNNRQSRKRHSCQVIQLYMNAQTGADLVLDGILGPKSVEVIAACQAAAGLAVDGKIGPRTWGTIKEWWRGQMGIEGVSLTPPSQKSPGDETAYGVDVSKWNQTVDFGAGLADGFCFAYLKSSHGDSDPDGADSYTRTRQKYARMHSEACDAAGMARGWYHWATPRAGDAIAEAEAFLRVVDRYGLGSLRAALDLEEGDGEASSDDLRGPRLSDWCVEWMRRVARGTGAAPLMYSYGSFLKAGVRPGHGLEDPSVCAGLWVAHYGVKTPSKWDLRIWREPLIWQHASDGKKHWNGSQNLDLNIAPFGLTPLLASP